MNPSTNSPIVGIAAIHVRDTEHQTPSQVAAWSNGKWPGVDAITTVVDAGEIQSTTGWYGGGLSPHSSHWNDFFSGDMFLPPQGKQQFFMRQPDPVGVVDAVSESQHLASANGPDTWGWFRTNFRGALDKIYPNNNYK
jgi:hypothetical protein